MVNHQIDATTIIQIVKSKNRELLNLKAKEGRNQAKIKELQRRDRMKKDDMYFKSREEGKEKRKKFLKDKELMILLRKRGITIRKIVNMIIGEDPKQSDYDFIRKVIFKDLNDKVIK